MIVVFGDRLTGPVLQDVAGREVFEILAKRAFMSRHVWRRYPSVGRLDNVAAIIGHFIQRVAVCHVAVCRENTLLVVERLTEL